MSGKRQQAGLLLGEGLLDGAGVVSGPTALMGHLLAPHQRLAVAFGQCGEGPAGPEGVAYIADGAFDAPFLITGAYLAWPRDAVIVSAEFQQPGIEVNLITAALQHHAFKLS